MRHHRCHPSPRASLWVLLLLLLPWTACKSRPKKVVRSIESRQLKVELGPAQWTTGFRHALAIFPTRIVHTSVFEDQSKSSYSSKPAVPRVERFQIWVGLDGLHLKVVLDKAQKFDKTLRQGDAFTFGGKTFSITKPKEVWETTFPLPTGLPVGQLAPEALRKRDAFRELTVQGSYQKKDRETKLGDRTSSWVARWEYAKLPLDLRLRFYYARAVGEALKASYPDKPLRFAGETDATPLERAMLQVRRTGEIRKVYGHAKGLQHVKFVGLEKEAKTKHVDCGTHKGRRVFKYISGYHLLIKERRTGKVVAKTTLYGGGGCGAVVTRYGASGAWGSHSNVGKGRRDAWFASQFRKL